MRTEQDINAVFWNSFNCRPENSARTKKQNNNTPKHKAGAQVADVFLTNAMFRTQCFLCVSVCVLWILVLILAFRR